MANATIGALRVDLGLNSAQFTAGLKGAQTSLSKFGNSIARGMALVGAAATVAAGALAIAVKGAIDHADELGKAAQKAGVTVEALSRLEYAAKLSDVSLESLTGGLQKLSKSMVDIASGKGPAMAFKALGIEVKNADGSLRDSRVVLADIADRFSRMEDGATKSALAIQIFGKSGADLIPLLNEGASGLARMADESDRVGATISTSTAKAAEKFNDTLTTIQQTLQGVVNKVMVAALPALQGLADAFADPKFAEAAKTFSVNVVGALARIIEEIGKVRQRWDDMVNFIHNGVLPPIPTTRPTSTNIEDRRGENPGLHPLTGASGDLLLNTTFGSLGDTKVYNSVEEMFAALKPLSIKIVDPSGAASALKAVNSELDVMNNSLSLQREEWERIQEPIKAAGQALADTLGGLVSDLLNGRDAVGGLINAFKGLGEQLIQMALNQMITGFISSLFGAGMGGLGVGKGLTGAATYGFSGNGVFGVPGFDGGGFTGAGSRSGGMDGKGGFMAMLHPNESVIDHTRGGGGGESVVRIEMAPGLVGSILKQAGDQSVQIVRSQAPAAVASAQRNRVL